MKQETISNMAQFLKGKNETGSKDKEKEHDNALVEQEINSLKFS